MPCQIFMSLYIEWDEQMQKITCVLTSSIVLISFYMCHQSFYCCAFDMIEKAVVDSASWAGKGS